MARFGVFELNSSVGMKGDSAPVARFERSPGVAQKAFFTPSLAVFGHCLKDPSEAAQDLDMSACTAALLMLCGEELSLCSTFDCSIHVDSPLALTLFLWRMERRYREEINTCEEESTSEGNGVARVA